MRLAMKILAISTLLTSFLTTACATRERIEGTAAAPAALGEIKVDNGSGGNTDFTIKVRHLAEPERMATGATDYIVWVQPEGSRSFQNVGILAVDENLKGKYSTTIPYRRFRVVVTPEPGRLVSQPTGPAVFDQKVER